ncbi:ferric reductase-like transmembrane domain-containing protein [Phenylobacterium ferrooxidans]|uniref:Ferric reductase-like transmembrane domain-containing protein n=1 Tax=Phenylobacterium ferrooxidans TaxID=2982689 RepID=A0ABW6CMQ0_9CAUL
MFRLALWLLLSAPGAWATYAYLKGHASYGEYIHATGDTSARLLIATLAVTPIRLLFQRARWTSWLMQRRRDFGVATFVYAVLHTVAYVARKGEWGSVLSEAAQPELGAGWVTLAIFGALALTSNDASVRRLGAAWGRLHRTVYLGALLTFAHWVLTAFNPTAALVHAAVLAVVIAVRVWLSRRRASRRDAAGLERVVSEP